MKGYSHRVGKMEKVKGFTLVELMVVVLIVGILAAVAVPTMRGRVDAAKWSEAKAGAGRIATALRTYAVKEQAATASLTTLGFTVSDLHGTYFVFGDYSITASSFTAGADPELTFTIRVDKAGLTPTRIELTNAGVWTESSPSE